MKSSETNNASTPAKKKETEAQALHTTLVHSSFIVPKGPIPDAITLREYQKFREDLPDKIINEWQIEGRHRRDNENKQLYLEQQQIDIQKQQLNIQNQRLDIQKQQLAIQADEINKEYKIKWSKIFLAYFTIFGIFGLSITLIMMHFITEGIICAIIPPVLWFVGKIFTSSKK